MVLACVQAPVVFNDPGANATYAIRMLEDLASKGVDLVVFPEAFLTGYCARTEQEAHDIAIPPDDPSILRLIDACNRLSISSVVGFACNAHGYDDLPEGLSNALVYIEPARKPRCYAKTHLPFLGFDRFAIPGTRLEPFETAHGQIGTLICYDMRPPEAARTLTLKGAQLIVLPTNWPQGAEPSADHVGIARAAENKVYFATCNRVGQENGTTFIGRSKIIDPSGKVLAAAGDSPEVLIAELNLDVARQKRTIIVPGQYELEIIACRQPDLYSVICDLDKS